jgi:hypothetical protein
MKPRIYRESGNWWIGYPGFRYQWVRRAGR